MRAFLIGEVYHIPREGRVAVKKSNPVPSREAFVKRLLEGEQIRCCRCNLVMKTLRDVSSVWCGTCRGYLCEDCVDQTSQCGATRPSIDVSEFS